MHELGIVYHIIKTVDEVVQEQKLSKVYGISLQIGEMSDVVPKFIEQAWITARQNTAYANTELTIDIIPAKARCKTCGHSDFVKKLGMNCPECNATDFEIISGREFLINEITAK